MSTIKVDGIRSNSASSDAITLANDGTCTANVTNNLSNRNKIINGGQQIFQRGTSEIRTGGNDGYYPGIADRWSIRMHTSMGQQTFSQDTSDTPDGFGSSQKLVRNNAGSSNAAKYFVYDTKLEGQDLQDFAKGTSSAKKFTLSFYVKTGVSGVYCVEMRDLDNSRMVGGTYTVSNTNWNRYTITFPADTTGAFGNDNGGSLWVRFWLAAGSNFTSGTARTAWAGSVTDSILAVGQTAQVGDNPADTWQITGVQLEVDHTGSGKATDFEHVSYADELRKCQRYFQNYITYAEYTSGGTGNLGMPITTLVTPMRTAPTFVVNNESKSSNWTFHSFNFSAPPNSAARGYSYFQVLINTSDSNYGYLRRYGNCTAEL